jgi:hypothetical protein
MTCLSRNRGKAATQDSCPPPAKWLQYAIGRTILKMKNDLLSNSQQVLHGIRALQHETLRIESSYPSGGADNRCA